MAETTTFLTFTAEGEPVPNGDPRAVLIEVVTRDARGVVSRTMGTVGVGRYPAGQEPPSGAASGVGAHLPGA